jgi:hypothetical protein
MTIKPTAMGTLARAIPANGGPNGAPGQTARTRKPAATAGAETNKISHAWNLLVLLFREVQLAADLQMREAQKLGTRCVAG